MSDVSVRRESGLLLFSGSTFRMTSIRTIYFLSSLCYYSWGLWKTSSHEELNKIMVFFRYSNNYDFMRKQKKKKLEWKKKPAHCSFGFHRHSSSSTFHNICLHAMCIVAFFVYCDHFYRFAQKGEWNLFERRSEQRGSWKLHV